MSVESEIKSKTSEVAGTDRIRILVVTEELAVLRNCARILERADHIVETALSPGEAMKKMKVLSCDVVFLDINLAWDEGIELLAMLNSHPAETAVVIIVGPSLVGSAVETMQHGNYEFITKPFTPYQLIATLGRALQNRTYLANIGVVQSNKFDGEFGDLSGVGPAMRHLKGLIERVASSGTSVLIFGEKGAGKEAAALAIHKASPLRLAPFI